MSMDIQFISFSEKEADAFWDRAQLKDVMPMMEGLEENGKTERTVSDALIQADLEAGGIIGGLEEGKHASFFLAELTEAFLPHVLEQLNMNKTEVNYYKAPKNFYLELFHWLSESKIKEKFSEPELAASLIGFYQDLKDVIESLKSDERALFIDVNDEINDSQYFLDRAKKRVPLFEKLETEYRVMKERAAQTRVENPSEISDVDQARLL